MEEDVVRAFRGTMFELRGIPLMAPPVGLRGC